MNVNSFACPIRKQDNPKDVTMVIRSCGYSHNLFKLSHLNVQGVQAPPQDLAVCLRPIKEPLQTELLTNPENLIMWFEYMKLMGVDRVFVYNTNDTKQNKAITKMYKQEPLTYVEFSDWLKVSKHVDGIVSEEAAINHCLFENMMKFNNIIVASVDDWIVPGEKFDNLKQFVRSEEYKNGIESYVGYRIPLQRQDKDSESNTRTSRSFIMNPRGVLGLAANHFIPLRERAFFLELKQSMMSVANLNKFKSQDVYWRLSGALRKEVQPRLRHLKTSQRKK